MTVVLQRVKYASVKVDGEQIGKCGEGLLLLLGVAQGDTEHDADLLSEKISKLRIFEDENGKMNKSVVDIGGEALVISNFTLLANYRKGNRPDYMNAARPDEANRLFEYFTEKFSQYVPKTECGKFGAYMKVELLNDGPVTIVMESEVLKK